jgi:hypothetical protein
MNGVIAVEEQKIKEAAYALWEQDGKPNGLDLEHWFKATSILQRADPEKPSSASEEKQGLPAGNTNSSESGGSMPQ